MAEPPVRCALVGAGMWGAVHMAVLGNVPDIEVVAVCDRELDRAKSFATQHGVSLVRSSLDELVGDGIELLDVVTGPASHASVVREGLDHGLNVFCEKPFTLDRSTAADLAALAATRGTVHTIGHQRRYDPSIRAVRRLIGSGTLGEIDLVTVQVMTPWIAVADQPDHDWLLRRSAGGGFLFQVMCHYIDLVGFLFGRCELEVVGVRNVRGDRSADAVDDVAVLQGRLPNGGVLNMVGSWSVHHPSAFRWEVHGSEGTVMLEPGGVVQVGQRGGPLRPLLPADDELPARARGLFNQTLPRDPFWGDDNVALMATMFADVAAAVRGAPSDRLFATFVDGVWTQGVLDTAERAS